MAASIIPISSDSFEESVGSHVPRVILFGAIPAIIHVIPVVPAKVPIVHADPLVAPEVGAVSVTSPVRVLDLVDYSSSFDSDPSEDSLPLAPELPLVSPFLCFDDSEADSESEPAEQRLERHESLAVHDAMFSIALVISPPGIHRRPAILIRPNEAILFGRPYRTHPNGPRKLLTARKRVRPFPARRLSLRRVSDHHSSPDYTSESSSSGSSSDSSLDTFSGLPLDSLSNTSSVHSSGCDVSGKVASPRLVYPPVMTPHDSEVLDVEAPTLADLLPPHKRFRDSYSPDDSREEHMEIDTVDEEAVADLGISDDVGAHTKDGIGMGVKDMTITRSEMTPKAIEELIAQRVAEALANYKATRTTNALETKNQSQNGSDDDNGNGDGGNNENGNLNENGRGVMPVARVCTYQEFTKCQPLNFKGTKGVVGLRRWKQCSTSAIVQRTIRVDAVFSMTWRDLIKLMTELYCLRNEIQKMELELWNLTVKNNDLAAYTQIFQELTLLCTRMVLGEEDRIERYVGGLPDNIQGNVMSAEPMRLKDAIRLANSLMDQKLKGYAFRSAENKIKFESNQRDN
ncbi:putative reverse transcriptase domain-containing protein, partial [Tanacetum coccineum]